MGCGCSNPSALRISPPYSPEIGRTYDHDIFLSHSRVDSQDFALALKERFTHKHNLSVWIDRDADFDQLHEIPRFVRRSRNLICLLSKNAFANGSNSWVARELDWAVKFKVNIILVRYNQVPFEKYYTKGLQPRVNELLRSTLAIPHSRDFFDASVKLMLSLLKFPEVDNSHLTTVDQINGKDCTPLRMAALRRVQSFQASMGFEDRPSNPGLYQSSSDSRGRDRTECLQRSFSGVLPCDRIST
jgi:hypothetical protein